MRRRPRPHAVVYSAPPDPSTEPPPLPRRGASNVGDRDRRGLTSAPGWGFPWPGRVNLTGPRSDIDAEEGPLWPDRFSLTGPRIPLAPYSKIHTFILTKKKNTKYSKNIPTRITHTLTSIAL